MKKVLFLSLLGQLILVTSLWAQGSQPSQPQHPPKPPKEAVEACKGKKDNDVCSFQSPRGEVSGTCFSHENHIACRPSHPPEGADQGGRPGRDNQGR